MGQAFNDDLMMHNLLKKHKLQVKFVPSLLMVNREESDLRDLVDNLKRLLLCSRLYHPRWLALVSDAISSILFPTLVIVLILQSLLAGNWYAAFLLFSCYSIYILGLILLMLVLEQGVQRVMRFQGQSIAKLSPVAFIKMLIVIPLTQWVYGVALLSSLWMSTVKWRGLTYRVQGPWNIRLVEYRPYHWLDQPVDPKASL